GLMYEISSRNRSELYLECLPLLMARLAVLPDDRRLVAQFAQLERKTSRVGKDTIGPPPTGHDDVANAVAGACVLALGRGRPAFEGLATYLEDQQRAEATAATASQSWSRRDLGLNLLPEPDRVMDPGIAPKAAADAVRFGQEFTCTAAQWPAIRAELTKQARGWAQTHGGLYLR